MKWIVSALAALLFLLAVGTQPRPAAAAPACRAGSVRLAIGLCCPRSAVTRRGGCALFPIRRSVVPPPIAYCYGGAVRDALGRCPERACDAGYGRNRFGRCERASVCANGRAPDALGQCPLIAGASPRCANGRTPDALGRCGLATICPGGGFSGANGLCPAIFLCSDGFAPVAGRCGAGSATRVLAPRLPIPPPALAARSFRSPTPARISPRHAFRRPPLRPRRSHDR